MITREDARSLVRTNPYPETMNGMKKFHEEVWINGTYGQPSKEDAIYQLEKDYAYFSDTYRGFYCEKKIHTGAFCEYDPISGYGPEHIVWRYFMHYAQYK